MFLRRSNPFLLTVILLTLTRNPNPNGTATNQAGTTRVFAWDGSRFAPPAAAWDWTFPTQGAQAWAFFTVAG